MARGSPAALPFALTKPAVLWVNAEGEINWNLLTTGVCPERAASSSVTFCSLEGGWGSLSMAPYHVPTAVPVSSACMDFFPWEGQLLGGEKGLGQVAFKAQWEGKIHEAR